MVIETMGEPFFHASKGLKVDGALVAFGEVMDGDGVGDGDGVRVGGGFDGGEGEVTEGDGNWGFSDIGDVSVHCRVKRGPRGKRGGVG